MKKGSILLILVSLMILATGVFFGAKYYAAQKNKQVSQPTQRAQTTMEVRVGSLQQAVEASGNIQPLKEKELSFRTSGLVEQVNIQIGDLVQKGDSLIQLSNSEERLNYLKEKNRLQAARINGSNTEIEEIQMSLEIALEKLAAKELVAPFSGTIVALEVEEGDSVTSGKIVAKIVDGSRYKVEVGVDESEAQNIKPGQQAVINLEALPDQQIKGIVAEIGQIAEVNSGVVTCPVTVLLDQTEMALKSGYSADLEIIVGKVENKVLIPITALINQSGKEMVMKDVQGKMTQVPVRTGFSSGLLVAVESGLEPGDKILVNTGSIARNNEGANTGQDGEQRMRVPGMIPGGGGVRGGRP